MERLFQLSRQFLRLNNKPFRRYFLEKQTLKNRFSILVGPRGVGKTVVLIQHLLDFCGSDFQTDRALYLPVDHTLVFGKSLYATAEEFYQLGGELLCFDEIHKCETWSQELKSMYDTFPKLRVLASGSSAMEIQRGSHDLSRRATVHAMYGLSFREFLGLHTHIALPEITLSEVMEKHESIAEKIIGALETKNLKILPLFRKYLRVGFFPYFQEFEDERAFFLTLEQNIRYSIESDLPAVNPTLSGTAIRKIKRLLGLLAISVPFTPDLKKLKQSLDIGDERTLKNYLKFLEDAGVIRTLSRSGRGMRELEKPEKIYLDNPNLVFALCGNQEENRGTLRETFFMNALSQGHSVSIPTYGDFLVNDRWSFEVGGKNKGFSQIKDIRQAFLALDDFEIGIGAKIPLWLFGFLY